MTTDRDNLDLMGHVIGGEVIMPSAAEILRPYSDGADRYDTQYAGR